MHFFPSALEKALSDHKYARQRYDVSEARLNHASAIVRAELLLSDAYAQVDTEEPWVAYEAEYTLGDESIARCFFDAVEARLVKRRALTERYRLDNSIVVEGIELAPATHMIEGITVHAPLSPFDKLNKEFQDIFPVMQHMDRDRFITAHYW